MTVADKAAHKHRWPMWVLAALILLLLITVFVWRTQKPVSTGLTVVNLGNEMVELEFYGAGLERPIASGPLLPQQRVSLPLVLHDEGELRLRAASPRASVDAVLLPKAAQLRDVPLQLEVSDGSRFVLVPAH